MKKRFLCLFLCLVMLLSAVLTACSSKKDEEGDDGKEDVSKEASANAMTLSMWIVSEEDVSAETAAAGMPGAYREGEQLCRGNGAVIEFADECVYAYLPASGMICVPMVVVFVLAEFAVVGSDIAAEPRVIGCCRMHHDALDRNLLACLIAGVFC